MSGLTPRVDVDLTRAVEALGGLRDACPDAVVHYRVAANDSPRLLTAFAEAGCAFDVRSAEELRAVVHRGVAGDRILSSHPVSTRAALAQAAGAGVRGFVVDSLAEVAKLAEVAPGGGVLVRLLASGSRCPSERRKFGCPADLAPDLLLRAASCGLQPRGVSVPAGWAATEAAVRTVDEVRSRAAALGIDLAVVHVDDVRAGAALPARGLAGSSALWVSAGHSLAAPGGVLVASVVAVVERAGRRWVHLDGIAATESVEIRTTRSGPVVPSVLAGPADAGDDVLFAAHAVALPAALREGDHVRFTHAGPRPWSRPIEERVTA
ncbi:hypothetical protein QI633_03575 [Nocardioides sp. QY071]|uniref:hypothetical protein n=1 Tax=Nocardioides sp. QY071 TaxID=3044187 RepID=UPI00249CE500|nr:hypothetical protein [Nocardioides sp. QY071]WGY02842.1 hypothetical protein QI633_03575 [Nocardioides sp. QY071]